MYTRTLRPTLALIAFFVVLHASRPAAADVTISGTVAEIGLGRYTAQNNGLVDNYVRFKLTDANQTKTCTGGGGSTLPAGYATFDIIAQMGREWYSMLLLSKKGAPITCILTDGIVCLVKDCALP